MTRRCGGDAISTGREGLQQVHLAKLSPPKNWAVRALPHSGRPAFLVQRRARLGDYGCAILSRVQVDVELSSVSTDERRDFRFLAGSRLSLFDRRGKTLGELIADLKNYPQVIVNVKVREKRPLDTIPSVVSAIRSAEDELRDSGRVVIRYSGTEALARVMIEAESESAMRRHADAIADAIRAELGV